MYRERFSVSVTIEWLIDSQSLSPHKAEQSNQFSYTQLNGHITIVWQEGSTGKCCDMGESPNPDLLGGKNMACQELGLTKSKFMSGGQEGRGKGFQAERIAHAKTPKKQI